MDVLSAALHRICKTSMEEDIKVKCFSSRFAFERRFYAASLTDCQCCLLRSCALKAAIVSSIASGFILGEIE